MVGVVLMNMRVREATTADVASIRAVAEASWERDYADLLTRDTVAAGVNDWYGESTLAERVTDERTPVRVAETDDNNEGGEVVAFAHGYVASETGHVLRLYVHPEERRARVGEAVLDAMVDALVDRGSDVASPDASTRQAVSDTQGFSCLAIHG